MAIANENRDEILREVEASIQGYVALRKRFTAIQWSTLLLVTVAGFFTTVAGNIDAGSPPWFASPTALTFWGLVAAIGSMVVQNLNPAQRAAQQDRWP